MDPYGQIVERVEAGALLGRRWRLRGGVSAHVEALELALPGGGMRRVVVRRHGAAHWKALVRDVTVVEFRLLTALNQAGLTVPRPLFVETRSELLGAPFFVMEYVEGDSELPSSELPGALAQMAEFLGRLHALDVDIELPAREDPIDGALSLVPATDPVCEVLRSLPRDGVGQARALVHGDYWPGNMLWKDGKLAAVLDWEDAAMGDPVSDLAGCRLELLWKLGPDAVRIFSAEVPGDDEPGHDPATDLGALQRIRRRREHESVGPRARARSGHASQGS